jgi:hypothetical protein
LATRRYVPFAAKYYAGNYKALCNLVDECWRKLIATVSLPTLDYVNERLNEAEFNAADWDDIVAADAGRALCSIDECIGPDSKNLDRSAAFANGLTILIGSGTWRIVNECMTTDRRLERLAESIRDGTIQFSVEEEIVHLLTLAEKTRGDTTQFVSLVRYSLAEKG